MSKSQKAIWQHNTVVHYLVSLLFFLLALWLNKLLWAFLEPSATPLFFAAVMLAAFYGGLGPGILVTILSTLAADYYFIPPYNGFEFTFGNLIRAAVFMGVALLISWLNASRKKLTETLRERHLEREQLVTQISGFNEELRAQVAAARQEISATNQALLATQQRLSRAERMAIAGQMAASLAHDIGTPLNAVSGHLQLLARDHATHAETQRRLTIVQQQVVFIIGIVKRLLEWTHRKPVVRHPLALNEVLQALIALVAPLLVQCQITVAWQLDPALPVLAADGEGLQQVFLNLITNSIEAMPGGGTLTIATHYDAAHGVICVVLHDTGAGIAPEALPHLFEPMWTTKASGSGFGLAIAQEIITDHEGEIEVNSGGTTGTTMQVKLPLAAVADTISPMKERVPYGA